MSLVKTTVVAVALAMTMAVTSVAGAAQGITSFSSTISTTEAGAHPDITTSFTLDSPGAPEVARNITFNAPEGMFGNPNAVPRCTFSDFALEQCQSDSQIGLITVYANETSELLGTAPIYDVQPAPEQTALLGFIVPTIEVPITVPVTVRTASDYGLRFTVSNITQLTPLASAELTFWGFPSDKGHDAERFAKGTSDDPAGCPGMADTSCIIAPTESTLASRPRPFTDNPSPCTGEPLIARLSVQTYQDPANRTHAETAYPPVTHCEKATFKPVLKVNPTTGEADSPSGLDITFEAPQFLGFALSPSELRNSIVTLPPGLTINPDAADGQSSCSDAQANFDSEGPANCPDQAKIGTVAIHSVALDGTLEGSVYIGQPRPGDQYRAFMIVDGFGLHAKIVGSFRPDPDTGQVTLHLTDLPQVRFDEFDVHLFASDRGLMATPTRCTLYETVGQFIPWNSVLPPVTSKSSFSIDSGPGGSPCPGEVRPFRPRLAAGTTKSLAGSFSDFSLQLDRDDGDQYLRDLTFEMPPGLTASLRGITYCPEGQILAAAQGLGRAEQAAPSCPTSSEIGTTNVAAGPGGHPFHAAGRMYLAGPFKGAPLSVVAVTPALAGPYDYGTVVVRVAIHVDPIDAHVFAASDTVPAIIGGVPIRMRSIRVSIDRPNFMIAPTNCSPFSVDSQGIGDQGTVVGFSSYFHVDNCTTLPFAPKMAVRQLGKRKDTRRSRNPRMRFELRTRSGDANIKSVAVTLPKAFAIDQRHLGNLCSRGQLESESCAGRQPIGSVETRTPLLDQPLKGPAYAVSGFGKLPRVVFILDGQVRVMPQAESSSVKGRLKTVVPVVPDVPIGYFRLDLLGGKQGYLVNTRNLCASSNHIAVRYTAQNGKTVSQRVTTKTACGKGSKAKRAARDHRRATR